MPRGLVVEQEIQIRVVLLAKNGFYARTVADVIRRYHGMTLSPSQIYRIAKIHGVSFKGYRDGTSREAHRRIIDLIGHPPRRVRTTQVGVRSTRRI